MTKQYSYLIFRINNSLYGVNTLCVKQIFLLPELTPIFEASPGIVGVVDLKGRVLPVMDLNLRFGQQTSNYSLSDQVIVVEQGEQDLGIIVDEVCEVRNIPETDIAQQIQSERSFPDTNEHQFITGVIRSENDILVMINLANLLQYISRPNSRERQDYSSQQIPRQFLPDHNQQKPRSNHQLIVKDREQISLSSLPKSPSQLTSEALAILRERANQLRQIDRIKQNSENVKNLAIVILNQEFFGVDLENVREFTNIEQVVPVPCCPPHIVGNMNLRGEILTLVDICQVLNLPPVNLSKISQLMVVEVDELRVGLTIEKVHDTITVDAQEIDLVPAASYSVNKEYFQGTLSFQNKMISILNIAKIIQNDGLIVDQSG